MSSRDRAVEALASTQYGLVTRVQARELEMSERMIAGRLAREQWHLVQRGVFRMNAAPESWEARVLAVCLVSGGVASHRTAAFLSDLDTFHRGRVEITVPRGGRFRASEVTIHESTQFDRVASVTIRGIPTTGLARTVLDLGAVCGIRKVELAAESAIRSEGLGWDDLLAVLNLHSRRGRDGCGRLRALLEYRYGDTHIPLSTWGRLVATELTERGIAPAIVEYPLTLGGDHVIQFDLAWPAHKVAVELDSVGFHLNRTSFERDRRKRLRARSMGWQVLEVTWSMYTDELDYLVAALRELLV